MENAYIILGHITQTTTLNYRWKTKCVLSNVHSCI